MAFGARQGAFLASAAIALVTSAPAIAQQRQFNVSAQDARTGIPEFARQAGVQISAPTGRLVNKRTNAVRGSKDVNAALAELIKGTGLSVASNNGRMIVLQLPSAVGNAVAGAPNAGTETAPPSGEPTPSGGDVNQGEIIVTAQKKRERLHDVPVPVTVLEASNLVDTGNVSLRDYFSSVPGLQIQPGIYGTTNVSIRGVSTTAIGSLINPTVGITVDGVPFGGSWLYDEGGVVPDFNPSDLSRIEILRGPQGTLFGASTLGGLINFVTVDPSTDAYSGRLEADVSKVRNGAEPGYNFRGAVNLPISDNLAVRASAFARQDPGYVDNPIRDVKGLNEGHSGGGRIALLWRPSESVSLKLSALYQDQKADGDSYVDVPTAGYPRTSGLGDLQQNDAPNAGKSRTTLQAYSATLNAKLGSINLTSISAYNNIRKREYEDFTDFFSDFTSSLYGTPDSLSRFTATTSKFDQEVHISSSVSKRLDWLLGVFYTWERTRSEGYDFAEDAISGIPVPNGAYFIEHYPGTYQEYAAFADLTFHLNKRLDVQVGGRAGHNDESFDDSYTGALVGNTVTSTHQRSTGNAFTYLVTPRYHLTPDLIVYARFASGYRPGGPNQQSAFCGCVVPDHYNPDMTYNYEAGVKGDLLNHGLYVDASLYYIDWRNTQIQASSANGLNYYYANAGQAKSEGIELSLQARPFRGLTVSEWVTVGESVLTRDLPASSGVNGVTGDRLPNSTKFSDNLSADYDFPIVRDIRGTVGAAVTFVGNRLGNFVSSGSRAEFPSYNKLDLHAALRDGGWSAMLYANNVTDKRGVLSSGANGGFPYRYYIIRPRTVGLSIAKIF